MNECIVAVITSIQFGKSRFCIFVTSINTILQYKEKL